MVSFSPRLVTVLPGRARRTLLSGAGIHSCHTVKVGGIVALQSYMRLSTFVGSISLDSYLWWHKSGLLQHFCKRNPAPESPNAGSPPHICFIQGCSQPSWFATLRRLGWAPSRLAAASQQHRALHLRQSLFGISKPCTPMSRCLRVVQRAQSI